MKPAKPKYYTSLAKACLARNKEFKTPENVTGLFWAAELGGEAGEVCNIIKKLERARLGMMGSRATLADLAQEVADVRISLQHICNHYGLDMDVETVAKFNKTSDNLNMKTHMAIEKRK